MKLHLNVSFCGPTIMQCHLDRRGMLGVFLDQADPSHDARVFATTRRSVSRKILRIILFLHCEALGKLFLPRSPQSCGTFGSLQRSTVDGLMLGCREARNLHVNIRRLLDQAPSHASIDLHLHLLKVTTSLVFQFFESSLEHSPSRSNAKPRVRERDDQPTIPLSLNKSTYRLHRVSATLG